ncbi:hypothetical protein NQ317_000724 [Molorchus minor]|uniref:Spondin domain-containing protein n=1 Tax=Molorchus minor TaxID=1323400 RepID=A0ABQ9IZ20_9CUCU|nr:hypothetical protein NQ317_000724 [Molorchus minor]
MKDLDHPTDDPRITVFVSSRRSHDKSFTLFRLGEKSSAGVKAFAETGRSDRLEELGQGEGGIYDEFNAPPITTGAGRTEAEFFVDGNHSRVSLMSRIVPSPDWFIGIDSFDLLRQWKLARQHYNRGEGGPHRRRHRQRIHLHGPRLADGSPRRSVPHHGALPVSSCRIVLHPNLNAPPIGTFQFIKAQEAHENKPSAQLSTPYSNIPDKNDYTTQERLSNLIDQRDGSSTVASVPLPPMPPRGNTDVIQNSIVDSYLPTRKGHNKHKKNRKVKKNVPRKIRRPRDCQVSIGPSGANEAANLAGSARCSDVGS